MYENRKELLNVVRKYLAGNATPQESAFLEAYYQFLSREEDFTTKLREEEKRLLGEQMENNIWAIIERPDINKAITRNLWPRLAAVAGVVIALSIGGLYLLQKPKEQQTQNTIAKQQQILPGSNKAFLTLGNGQRISLTDARNGTLANQAGQSIKKTANGKIEYDDLHNNHNAAEAVINTIETPRGGQYQVSLPDGSKVWLNAATILKYPARFTGADRQVELQGEAYFEVAKDRAHPFKVKTDRQSVEVLGTHFNINSYNDEPSTRTTLLEGSVKITADQQERIIKPGDQAILKNNSNTIRIQPADEEEVLAWKNGLFVFNDEPLESIMRKVSRWYDVDIQYENIDKTQAFGGGISRYSNVDQVLKRLESTRLVHFKIEGRTIHVSKYQQ